MIFNKYYRILHELSLNINLYKMGLGHAIKQAFDKYFKVLGTSFINL